MKNIYSKRKKGAIIFCVILLCFVLVSIPIFNSIIKQQKIDDEIKQLTSLEDIKNAQGIQGLVDINSDCAGWITIKDVNISLPAVFSNNQSDEFYLSHDFKKQSSILGVPYLTKSSTLDTDNIVIVGHSAFNSSNNKNSVIFGNLKNYLVQSTAYNYKIELQTLQSNIEYTIFTAFSFSAIDYSKASKIFNTNTLQTAQQLQEFEYLLCDLSNDNSIKLNIGDKFLTLYTCDKDNQNQRIMVVAKQNI